jgi:hypothetical protein
VGFDLQTRARTVLTTGETQAVDLAVEGNVLYWINTDGGVRRTTLAGGPSQPVTDGPPNPRALVVHNGTIYWTIPVPPSIVTAPVGGGATTQFPLPMSHTPTEITAFTSQVYWLESFGASGTVSRMPLAGGPPTSVTGTQVYSALGGLAVDTTGVYYTAGTPNGLFRVMSTGAPAPTSLSGLTPPPGKLAMNDAAVYFIDEGGTKIKRIPKPP